MVLKASGPVLFAEKLSLSYLNACAFEDRPTGIVWERVANLNSCRGKDISEKGTACEQYGYIIQFQCLDNLLKASLTRIWRNRL